MGARPPLSAAYFDGWYAQMARFPAKDEIQQPHLVLPAHLPSISSLTGAGIGKVSAALRLSPAGTVLDLACGRGGPVTTPHCSPCTTTPCESSTPSAWCAASQDPALQLLPGSASSSFRAEATGPAEGSPAARVSRTDAGVFAG